MKFYSFSKNKTVNLALTGLMGALVFVSTMFFKIQIPISGDKTMIGFANVFCILSGLLLGPLYGGAAAGIGSFLFDLVGGWASSAPVTLITKFAMAFICGLIAHSGKNGIKCSRIIIGAIAGSLSYCALYIGYSYIKEIFIGSALEVIRYKIAIKSASTLTNAVIADIISIPLFLAIKKAISKNSLSEQKN